MCGIAGRAGTDPIPAEVFRPFLLAMNREQAGRGPDGEGIFLSMDGKIGLAHTRLAILDLSPAGAQPMGAENNRIWIAFNGEIYNFPELRAELERNGRSFATRTDTEVILALYAGEGEQSFRKLRGMFAFALYDKRTGDLFLVRDRYGIKPLYYWEGHREILFASTVKALDRSGRVPGVPEPSAWISFLLAGSVPAPITTIRDVRSIPPGHYGKFLGARGAFTLHSYYRLDFSRKSQASARDAAKEVRILMEDAVRAHLISDAPLGVFLSGGIDSSLLVAMASQGRKDPVVTLSVRFAEEKFDEGRFQRIVAERYRTEHREMVLREREVQEMFPAFFEKMDQPSIDGINTYAVSWAARKVGLKAVLSGLGGDELFCGYDSARMYRHVRKFLACPLIPTAAASIFGSFRKKYLRLGGVNGRGPTGAYLAFRGLYAPSELIPVFGEEAVAQAVNLVSRSSSDLTAKAPIDELTELEFRCYLLNQLLKDSDVMGMAHSVEIRVPFLDHLLVDYIAGLQPSCRYRKGMQKGLLADSCRDLLPDEIWTRRKQGFTFPLEDWLKGDLGRDVGRIRFREPNWQTLFEMSWRGFRSGREHWSRPYAWYVLDRLGVGTR